MTDRKASEHQDRVAGTGRDAEDSAFTEHRDTADASSADHNEVDPDVRREAPRTGPTTHDDTRITRKDGGRA